MDEKKIIAGIRLIIEGIGENPDRPGLRRTPERVSQLYQEIFSGLDESPEEILTPMEGEKHDEMVLLKDIPFYSTCEHHLLPFSGSAHIAYIPEGGRITGISSLARALEVFARRPQVQERLTTQLADLIMKKLRPKGCMVVIDAEHLCMSMRGIRKPGSRVVTSAVRGIFRTKQSTREELLQLIREK